MSFNQSVLLPVSPDEAFALVTEPERLRRWLSVSAYIELRAGGDFRWTIATGSHAAGTVREVDPGRRLVLGFGWDEDDALPPDSSTVTIVIEPADDGAKVTLTHEGLNEEQSKQHAEGWEHYLERLERYATTGDAGVDSFTRVPGNLNPVTATEAVLAAVQPVLRLLGPEDRPKPTPCEDFDANDLFHHLMGSLVQLGGLAGATVVPADEGTVENQISLTAGQAIDAWRAVDLDGTLPGPDGAEVPAVQLAGAMPVELALHGWDFAQTCGVELDISDEVVAYLRTLAEGIDPEGRTNGSLQGCGHGTRRSVRDRPARSLRRPYAAARLISPRHHRWSSSERASDQRAERQTTTRAVRPSTPEAAGWALPSRSEQRGHERRGDAHVQAWPCA